tara:strand:+ start:2511 stop:2744 length:234 start_codon:yes stop_codon:yes gene_type:complete
MKKIEKEEIDRIIALRNVNSDDKRAALLVYRKYIDPKAVFCLNCDASVRQMFIRLRTWWNNKTVAYTFIKEIKPKTK